MKFYIDQDHGTVFFMKKILGEDELCFIPLFNNNTFDTEEWSVVERPHDEVPEEFYEQVIKELKS